MSSFPKVSIRQFVIPVTVMLSFVSFWRAASIVLCDIASSAYYVGGISEKAIGKSAPWFILAIMLFSYAVRAIYIESCSMFVRGGVYRVVREAMGGTAAKFSVSALMFDYVLTGPISGVSAGLYLAALINELGEHFHIAQLHVPAPWFAALFAMLVTVYFWYTNRVGIPFSSTRALRIMQITTVMVVILVAWCLYTIFTRGFQPVPAPTPAHFQFGPDALGWLRNTALPKVTVLAILIGLGHSVLALSGEETLAQVYREIEAPKQRNLLKTGLIIFVYSLLFTSLVSFFAVMIIPDAERPKYLDNLIGGLSMFLAGPFALRLLFHGFVVLVGVLILSGAVNTSIIGSNGVLSRVAEDGVMPPWFREPHRTHGTSHRIITLIVALQLLTILLSRGNVDALGEAYAFGVVWSFAMKGLAVVVLRFKHPETKHWKFPLNVRVGRYELPLGLIAATAALFLMALMNLFTKSTATISGSIFTIVFFLIFSLSERRYAKEQAAVQIKGNPDPSDPFREKARERFRLEQGAALSLETLGLRPGCQIVGLKRATDLRALDRLLAQEDPSAQDVVVIVVNCGALAYEQGQIPPARLVSDTEGDVFSEAVFSAEKAGKPVKLLALIGEDATALLLQAAGCLQASGLWLAASRSRGLDVQEKQLREAWNSAGHERALCVSVVIKTEDSPVEIQLAAS